MTISPRSGSLAATLLPTGALGLLALGACNAIFGIEPGIPNEATGAGGATSSGSATGSSSTGLACGMSPNVTTGLATDLQLSASNGNDEGTAAAYDTQGNLFAAGYFTGTELTLGGDALTPVGDPGAHNAFALKYDAAGNYLWGRAYGGTKSIRFNAAGTDAAGNVYLAGETAGKVKFGDKTIDTLSDPAEPTMVHPDALVVALDPGGEVKWATSFGNELEQRALRLAVDAAGNTFVAGVSHGKINFGDGEGPVGDDSWWSFFFKLDPTGKLDWVSYVGAWNPDLTPDYGNNYFEIAIAVDATGHVIIGGEFHGQTRFKGTATAPIGGTDAFVASLDTADGTMLWYRIFHQPIGGDPATDGDQWITALTVDPCSGDIYAAGNFTEGIDFGPAGHAKVTKGDPKDADIFLARLSGSNKGEPMWLKSYGDSGRQDATVVKVSPDGTVLLGGFLHEATDYSGVDFGDPAGVYKPVGPPKTVNCCSDAFLLKLEPTVGDFRWAKRLGDGESQVAFDIAINAQKKIILAGAAESILDIGDKVPPLTANLIDVYLAHFDP
jgi:hypothetical protein